MCLLFFVVVENLQKRSLIYGDYCSLNTLTCHSQSGEHHRGHSRLIPGIVTSTSSSRNWINNCCDDKHWLQRVPFLADLVQRIIWANVIILLWSVWYVNIFYSETIEPNENILTATFLRETPSEFVMILVAIQISIQLHD